MRKMLGTLLAALTVIAAVLLGSASQASAVPVDHTSCHKAQACYLKPVKFLTRAVYSSDLPLQTCEFPGPNRVIPINGHNYVIEGKTITNVGYNGGETTIKTLVPGTWVTNADMGLGIGLGTRGNLGYAGTYKTNGCAETGWYFKPGTKINVICSVVGQSVANFGPSSSFWGMVTTQVNNINYGFWIPKVFLTSWSSAIPSCPSLAGGPYLQDYTGNNPDEYSPH